jgi:hypothetical protein
MTNINTGYVATAAVTGYGLTLVTAGPACLRRRSPR